MDRSLTRHLPKIGTPRKVEGIYHGKNAWFRLIITGTLGKIVLRGCSWGYGGEGPRATLNILQRLGCHPFDCEQIAFRAPQLGTPKPSQTPMWRLILPATGAQLTAGQFVSSSNLPVTP